MSSYAPHAPAGAFSKADASARAFIDDWKRGHRRAPHFSECEAAASASASSFSFGKGAFSAADADAEAEARGFDDWRGKFITACQASASAHAESSSSGGGVASASNFTATTVGRSGTKPSTLGVEMHAVRR